MLFSLHLASSLSSLLGSFLSIMRPANVLRPPLRRPLIFIFLVVCVIVFAFSLVFPLSEVFQALFSGRIQIAQGFFLILPSTEFLQALPSSLPPLSPAMSSLEDFLGEPETTSNESWTQGGFFPRRTRPAPVRHVSIEAFFLPFETPRFGNRLSKAEAEIVRPAFFFTFSAGPLPPGPPLLSFCSFSKDFLSPSDPGRKLPPIALFGLPP